MSPADLADYADKTQNHNNITNCLSLRNNAACCIPLRNLRYLRENIHTRVLNLLYKETPMSLADHADDRRQTPKTTITSRCSSLRNNAACCIPLRDLRYLRENNTQEYSINIHRRNPSISRRFTQTKPKTTKQHKSHVPHLSTKQQSTRTGIH